MNARAQVQCRGLEKTGYQPHGKSYAKAIEALVPIVASVADAPRPVS